MSPFFLGYTALWIVFCSIAGCIAVSERKCLASDCRHYVQFLCVPWKLMVFVPALLFVTFAGHFTNDETWDMVTGGGMALLTFLTAPWAIGVIYQALRGKRSLRFAVIAVALCLFSTSWFYDSYLFLRDGHYTSRWLGNLMLSPVMYLMAALLWNLEADGAWPTFSFLRDNWPEPPADQRFGPLFIVAFPLIASAGVALVSFVRWHW
jgi:hypothetical protein